jgi:hypothetical protein
MKKNVIFHAGTLTSISPVCKNWDIRHYINCVVEKGIVICRVAFIMNTVCSAGFYGYENRFEMASISNWPMRNTLGYSKNLDNGQWTVDSGQWTVNDACTHRLSHAQASFPTSHTVLSNEVNLVYLGRVDNEEPA